MLFPSEKTVDNQQISMSFSICRPDFQIIYIAIHRMAWLQHFLEMCANELMRCFVKSGLVHKMWFYERPPERSSGSTHTYSEQG
jgi:hypothetical protein